MADGNVLEMPSAWERLRRKAFNRLLKIHYDTQSCHLGGNISCLDILLYLFHYEMKPNDVLVISKGHSAGALYVVLWTLGKISDEELDTFHRDGTMLCGHVSARQCVFSTGSLGHGLSLATGLAVSKSVRGESGRVFCLLSDGELDEGMTQEALRFRLTHRNCDNLRVVLDNNGWQGFSHTVFSLNEAHYDGHDFNSLKAAFDSDVLSLVFKTVKGRGTAHENTLESHYLPLTKEQYEKALL